MEINEFRDKWRFYKAAGRAQIISPHFRAVSKIRDRDVAATFASAELEDWPYSKAEGATLSEAGFAYWLGSNRLPDVRISGFERLTGLPVSAWSRSTAAFQKIVQTRAGELIGWADLYKHARRNGIEIEVCRDEIELRFQPIAAVGDDRPPSRVWAGCRARVWLSADVLPDNGEHKCAWLIADYGAAIFVLDPLRLPDGAPSITRLSSGTAALPRNRANAVGLSSRFAPGQCFDTILVTFDLDDQPAEVIASFAGLERQLVSHDDPYSPVSHERIRETLDEAARLIRSHQLDHVVFREPCLIITAPPS